MRAVLYHKISIIISILCNQNLRGIFIYALNTPVGYMCTMTHVLGNNIIIYIIYYCYVDIMRIRKRKKKYQDLKLILVKTKSTADAYNNLGFIIFIILFFNFKFA